VPDDPDLSCATLSDNARKARYGLSYVHAICSQVGVGMIETAPDEDVLAIDCFVNYAAGDVRVQVKCTSSWTITGASLTFPLEERWVQKWNRSHVPVYLVVVIVPSDPDLWLRHDEDGTFHGAAAFWVRVPKNPGDSIEVPKDQRLTRETLVAWNNDLLSMYTPGGES
jgi:hypothetical protein